MKQPSENHLSAERMQAFLEGDLPGRERGPIEEHLASCARCSAELEGWRVLFADLSGLAPAAPRADFADRVMARVQMPASAGHLAADVLQDFVDGLLPARRVARVRAHVDTCPTCAHELEGWQGVVGALGRLDRFAPREGFAARVMAAVRLPSPLPTAARASVWTTAGDRALVLVRRMVPRTRRAWAALSGVAVTPAVIFGLVCYTLFSHPTLTMQALVSFALWQLGDLFALGWNAVAGTALELGSVLGTGSFIDLIAGSPLLVAGGALAYSALAALALRVLYKNLFADRRHVRLQTR
jgi:anti-sigma factor RsiW